MRSLLLLCIALAVVTQAAVTERRRPSKKQLRNRPRIPEIDPTKQFPNRPRIPEIDPTKQFPNRPRIPEIDRPQLPNRPRLPQTRRQPYVPRITNHVNNFLCDTCTEFVTEFVDLVESLDENEILSMLTGMCDDLSLPGDLSTECKDLVNEYIPEFFAMVNNIDPQTACAELYLCSEEDIVVPTMPTMGSYRSGNFKPLNRLFFSVKERIQRKFVRRFVSKFFNDDVVCDGCKETVQFIHDLLSNNETLADIVSAIEMGCAYLPEEFQKVCDDYVQLLPEILITIANTYFMPDEDCQAVGLCPGEIDVMIPELPDVEILTSEIPELPGLPELPEVPAEFQRILTDFGNVPNINKQKKKLNQKNIYNIKPKRFQRAIPKVKLPNKTKKLAQKVSKTVPKYVKDVPALPEVVTDILPEATEMTLQTNNNETCACKLCSYAVKTFAAFVVKHKNEFAEAIIEGTTEFCDRLPEPYSTKCTDEVHPYMNKFLIEGALILYLTPEKICPYLVDNCP